MTDRPIIFSAPMIRALIDGRKTQTRRLLKPQPIPALCWDVPEGKYPSAAGWSRFPYAPGDCLWVREALDLGDRAYPIGHATYAADGYDVDLRPAGAAAWAGDYKRRAVPSIHMPRWASRLTLTVTDVRVQRLQDIRGEDCIAEGVQCETCAASWSVGRSACNQRGCFEIRQNFRDLWNSIHGPDAWAQNPWISATTFTVHHCNIDQMGASE